MSELQVGDPAAPATDEPSADVLICEADVVQLDLPPDQDPFDAALQVAGIHPSGTELVLWLRLTPTAIDRLATQLRELLREQQTALGITQQPPVDNDSANSDADPTDPDPGDSRIRRFLDPLGLRHVHTRSSRSTVIMAAAIAALMLLALLVSLVRG